MVSAGVSKRRQAIGSVATVVAIAVVAALTWVLGGNDQDPPENGSATAVQSSSMPLSSGDSQAVPAHVQRTLALIDAGEWPAAAQAPGTHGGDVFRNAEGNLPATDDRGHRITYREWDVNPKEPGQSRDAERIVTGSDGSAWYTSDHYRTFVQIRGPTL